MPPKDDDIERTAAVIRGGKYPFKNLTFRDRAYLNFFAMWVERNGGQVTLKQISDSGELPDYNGSDKPHDAGIVNRLRKAGLVLTSADGHTISLTKQGWAQLQALESFSISTIADQGAQQEVARQMRRAVIAARPDQRNFSKNIRLSYQNRCAVSGCETKEALEAAHIKVDESHNKDFNEVSNGILLRTDIHALFDSGLITLTRDGAGIEISMALIDPIYEFLKTATVYRPSRRAPSPSNILHHRRRFKFEEQA